MAFQLITPLFHKIDTATAMFITDISSRSIAEITPLVISGLTLTFIFYGLLIIRGTVEVPVMDFLGRSIRIGIIISIALTGGLYQSTIADAIVTIPDELAIALISNSTHGGNAASLIDQSAEKGFDVAAEAFDKAGFLTDTGVLYALFGVIILLATGILVSIGAAFILIAKISLAILAGLGPIFIIALLFQSTQRFFEVWAAQIFNYTLLIVLFAAVFGLMINIFASYMSEMKFDGIQSISYGLGGALILSVAMIIVLLQLPSMATGLAGGLAISFINEARAFARGMGAIAGRPEKRTSSGKVTQRGSGIIGGSQMSGRLISTALGHFRGTSGKAA